MNALRIELELLCQDQENATQSKERGGKWLDYLTEEIELRNKRRDRILSDHLSLLERIANLREALEGLLNTECILPIVGKECPFCHNDRPVMIAFAKGVLGVERGCDDQGENR